MVKPNTIDPATAVMLFFLLLWGTVAVVVGVISAMGI